MLEVDRQAKRIEMLEETVRRKQYELDQVRDRLERREKDVETLKAEIIRLNNNIVQSPKWLMKALDVKEQLNEALRKSENHQKKVIKAMATWIDDDEDSNKSISICANNVCPGDYISRKKENVCIDCIINYFESEVKE